jgi:general stress protein YciG
MTQEQREEIARKGGQTISSRPGYMAEIGRKGGRASGFSKRMKLKKNG